MAPRTWSLSWDAVTVVVVARRAGRAVMKAASSTDSTGLGEKSSGTPAAAATGALAQPCRGLREHHRRLGGRERRADRQGRGDGVRARQPIRRARGQGGVRQPRGCRDRERAPGQGRHGLSRDRAWDRRSGPVPRGRRPVRTRPGRAPVSPPGRPAPPMRPRASVRRQPLPCAASVAPARRVTGTPRAATAAAVASDITPVTTHDDHLAPPRLDVGGHLRGQRRARRDQQRRAQRAGQRRRGDPGSQRTRSRRPPGRSGRPSRCWARRSVPTAPRWPPGVAPATRLALAHGPQAPPGAGAIVRSEVTVATGVPSAAAPVIRIV